MREIVFVVDHLSFTTGGPLFIVQVLRKLSQNGYKVTIVTGAKDYKNSVYDEGLNVVNLQACNPYVVPSRQPRNVINCLFKSIKVIKNMYEKTPFILHLNSHFPVLISSVVKVKIDRKIPIVCSIHHLEDMQQFPGLGPKIAKLIIEDIFEINSFCDIIHTPSKYVKNRLKKLGVFNKKRILTIPPGIDTKKYFSIPKKPEDNLFLMIGRLENRKHYEHAILAFKIVRKANPNTKLYIIGEGSRRKYLEHLIKRFSLEKNVFLLGNVNEEDKLNLLSKAQALIHLGYPEGFGVVILESLASGTPVISYDINPINEIINPGVTGILISKDNVLELAKVIINFYKFSFNENLLRKFAKMYDIRTISNMFAKLYSSVDL